MSIRLIEGEDGGHSPQIFCDGCHERINDSRDALVAWDGHWRNEHEVRVFVFLHRNDCDKKYRRGKDHTRWIGVDEFVDALAKSVA